MARPVWQNEVIQQYKGSFDPQYKIQHAGGTIEEAKLTLMNPITTEGTPHNADNMNNLFDMDNMDSMKGNIRKVVFNADGSITEEIRDKVTNILNASRVTTFPDSSSIKETSKIYTNDGLYVLRETTITTRFNADGTITEEVS